MTQFVSENSSPSTSVEVTLMNDTKTNTPRPSQISHKTHLSIFSPLNSLIDIAFWIKSYYAQLDVGGVALVVTWWSRGAWAAESELTNSIFSFKFCELGQIIISIWFIPRFKVGIKIINSALLHESPYQVSHNLSYNESPVMTHRLPVWLIAVCVLIFVD